MEEKKFSFLAGEYDSAKNLNSDAPEVGKSETWGEVTSKQKEIAEQRQQKQTLERLRKEREKEENEDSPLEKRMMVIDGATLKCPYAQSEGKLKVTSNELNLQDKLWATEGDCNNMINLQFSGVCNHPKWGSNKPACMGVINLSPWQNLGTTIVQEQNVLIKESCISCNPTPNAATAKAIPKVKNIASSITSTTTPVNTGGVKGVSYVSALRMQNEIHNSFWGSKFLELKKLFTLDSDKRTMKMIDTVKFNTVISGLSADERALAYAYFLAINTSETHYVDMTMSYETLNAVSLSALSLSPSTKGKYIDEEMGGGVNTSYGGGTLTVVVMNSKADIGDYTYNPTGSSYARYSTPAELLAHEMLGHGYGRIHGSATYRHEDAIQMSNLYWRVRAYHNFYRSGAWHGSGVLLDKITANKIPTHFIK